MAGVQEIMSDDYNGEERRKGDEWNGKERRKDVVSVRLALLERSYFENKEHQTILSTDMKEGFSDIKKAIHESTASCKTCRKEIDADINSLKAWRNWISGAYAAIIAGIGIWLQHHKVLK